MDIWQFILINWLCIILECISVYFFNPARYTAHWYRFYQDKIQEARKIVNE